MKHQYSLRWELGSADTYSSYESVTGTHIARLEVGPLSGRTQALITKGDGLLHLDATRRKLIHKAGVGKTGYSHIDA